MIRPVNDYRIGNLVLDEDGELCKIEQLSSEKMECFQQVSNIENKSCISTKYPSNIYAIALTEEWLLKLGFKKSKGKWGNDFHILEKDGFICMFTIEHWTDTQEDSKFKNHWHCKYQLNGNKLKYIHQVQNLFFALCGEELVFSFACT